MVWLKSGRQSVNKAKTRGREGISINNSACSRENHWRWCSPRCLGGGNFVCSHCIAVSVESSCMTISSTYARFDCRTCGETFYSPIPMEKREGVSKHSTLELSCSSGHTDQYSLDDVVLVPKRPEGHMRMRHSLAAGG